MSADVYVKDVVRIWIFNESCDKLDVPPMDNAETFTEY